MLSFVNEAVKILGDIILGDREDIDLMASESRRSLAFLKGPEASVQGSYQGLEPMAVTHGSLRSSPHRKHAVDLQELSIFVRAY